jgi:Flp pilus assembly CpaF family ATPase
MATVLTLQSSDSQEQRVLASLGSEARILLELVEQPRVEDVVVNPDGTLWINKTGEGFTQHGRFAQAKLEYVLRQIAHIQGLEFSSQHPVLETDFPGNGARVTGLRPPIVSGVTLAIRPHPKVRYSLKDYVNAGILTEKSDPLNARTNREEFIESCRGKNHAEILSLAVASRQNIVVGGSTGSGKTTALNMVFDEVGQVCPRDRIVGIEDTRELQWYGIQNCVPLLSSLRVSAEDCLRVSLRLKPHRIVVGEVRTKAVASTLIEAWNTGHRGGVATVHSDDALSTLQRFEELLGDKESRPSIARAVNVVFHIDVCDSLPAGRKIREVLLVHTFNSKTHEYEYEFV